MRRTCVRACVCERLHDALACVSVCSSHAPWLRLFRSFLVYAFPLLNSGPREHAGGYAHTEELDKHFYLFTVRNYQSALNINTAKGRER